MNKKARYLIILLGLLFLRTTMAQSYYPLNPIFQNTFNRQQQSIKIPELVNYRHQRGVKYA